MKLKILTIFMLAASISLYAQKKETLTFKDIKSIRLTTAAGDGIFKKGSGNEVKVMIEYTYDDNEFEFEMDQRGSTLYLDEKFKRGSVSGRSDWTVEIPDGIDVDFKSGSGRLDIDGLKMNIRSTVGSGSIMANETSGDFRITTGSGNVDLQNHEGDLELTTGSGDISVSDSKGDFRLTAGSGRIDLRNATGGIDATVGSGNVTGRELTLEYASDFTSGSGNVSIQLTAELTSDIRLTSGSGNAVLDFGGKTVNATVVMEANERYGRIISPYKFDKEEIIEGSSRIMTECERRLNSDLEKLKPE